MADEPVFTKAILDANKGVTNIIEAGVIKKDLIKVIDRLFNTLKKHYGPLSEFAALDSRNPLDNTKFTKDGINIVRAIEFTSPQEDWIRKTVAFIGERVEASVGDGTTSAMMFTCAMMKRMLESIDEIKPIAYTTLRNEFNALLEDIDEGIDSLTYSVKYGDKIDQDRVAAVVYQQVYTASHGDIELAKAFMELYRTTPPELWDKMIYERLTYESDKRFDVVYTDGQYRMSCDVLMNGMLNQEFCTWYRHDDCILIVMNNPIMQDTDAWDYIFEKIEKDVTPDHPMVILCHSNMATSTYQELTASLNELASQDKRVAIFTVNTTMGDWNPDVNDFRSLQLLCDMDLTKLRRTQNRNELVTVEHARAVWRNKSLSLDNLYEVPVKYKGELRRHMTIDGQHLHFTDYLAAVKKYGEGYSKLPGKDNRDMATLMYRTYAKLMYTKTGCLQIGGSVHDNVALVDVVDDCIRATSRALCKGITYGNNRALYTVLRSLDEPNSYASKTTKWLIKTMMAALGDIAIAQLELLYPNKKFSKSRKQEFVDLWFTSAVDLLNWDFERDFDEQECVNVITSTDEPAHTSFSKMYDYLTEVMNDTDYGINYRPIVQPADTDISMLRRFGEVALKFALSGRIIISNSAYVGDRKKRGEK